MHLYSTLNRDAASAVRKGDEATAVRIGRQAMQLDASPEAKRIAAALKDVVAPEDVSSSNGAGTWRTECLPRRADR